jgi:hypothetical protein
MRTMQALRVAAIALSFSSAAMAQTILDGSYPEAAPFDFQSMHNAVSSTYDDPRSAQYKSLSVQDTGKNAVVCGLANFRNANGGYDPFEPFVVELRDGKVRATIPNRHRLIQTDIVAHSPCGKVLGVKPTMQ